MISSKFWEVLCEKCYDWKKLISIKGNKKEQKKKEDCGCKIIKISSTHMINHLFAYNIWYSLYDKEIILQLEIKPLLFFLDMDAYCTIPTLGYLHEFQNV